MTKKRDQRDGAATAEQEALQAEPVEETPETEGLVAPEVVEEAASEAEEEPSDELTSLRQELAEARAKEAEYLDGWQRARAELANARKRFQREQEQAYANAKASVFAALLPVIEDLTRAFETAPGEVTSLSWFEGLDLVERKLQRLLEQEGIEAIEATGQEFDPFYHEAVTHEPSETVPQGHVIGELQKGYKLGDRVLRPSMVRVSAGPAAGEAPPEEETGADEE